MFVLMLSVVLVHVMSRWGKGRWERKGLVEASSITLLVFSIYIHKIALHPYCQTSQNERLSSAINCPFSVSQCLFIYMIATPPAIYPIFDFDIEYVSRERWVKF